MCYNIIVLQYEDYRSVAVLYRELLCDSHPYYMIDV